MLYINVMGLILIELKTHDLLRTLVNCKRSKNKLTRDPPNSEIIDEALNLLAKKWGLNDSE